MDVQNVERRRAELEKNIEKLRASLRHWQTWEAEYDGLKDEISALPEDYTPSDLLSLASNYEGELVTEKEVKDIFGLESNGTQRSASQLVNLISHRVSYVAKNATTLEKQLLATEVELEELGNRQQTRAQEQGLPLTEIIEELDDEDNVISGRTTRPGEQTPQVLEMLKKAGLEDEEIPPTSKPHSPLQARKETGSSSLTNHKLDSTKTASTGALNQPSSGEVTLTNTPLDTDKGARPRKKSVSFAEGTKPESTIEPTKDSRPTKSNTAVFDRPYAPPVGISKLAQETFPPDVRAIELDDEERPIGVNAPSNPLEESPQDAALRREIEQYSLNEVGAIVAQLDAEEGSGSDFYSEDEETDDDDDDDHGLTKGIHMDDEYREQMLELEKKLGVSMIQNIGPQSPEILDPVPNAPAEDEHPTRKSSSEDTTKSVRFAKELDVVPTTKTDVQAGRVHDKTNEGTTSAFTDSIIERKSVLKAETSPTVPPQKVSKFKASRQNQQATSQVRDSLLSDITERAPGRPAVGGADTLDELDPEVLDREVRSEYYRKRNDLVDQQGGFSRQAQAEQEDILDEDDVPRDASGRRISRFKAARMDPSRAW